jgi:hypothetical protein
MFGMASFAQSTFASLGGTNRIQYANNGAYSYTGIASTLLNSKYLEATNGTYNYIGSNAMVNINTQILAENGVYAYNGFTSTNKLFLGDWEFEFGAVDVWTCQDEGATAVWTTETTTPITWN